MPHVGGGSRLHHPSRAHDDDPVGEREGLLVVVGHVDRGQPGAIEQLAELTEQALAPRTVEGAERLVEHEQPRLDRERAGQRDPLLLTTRQLRDPAIAERAQPDEIEHLGDAAITLVATVPAMRNPNATLPVTSRCGNNAYSWNIRPKRRR